VIHCIDKVIVSVDWLRSLTQSVCLLSLTVMSFLLSIWLVNCLIQRVFI